MAKRGQGEPVLVLPGFMADDSSTIILRQFLNSIGYKSQGWGQGVNVRGMMDHLPGVLAAVRELHDEYRQKVRLVGWSRGGILSREIARDHPELIERVVTIGSPVKGGVGASSIGAAVVRQIGLTPEEMNQLLHVRQRKPITVPIRSIYSKLDGVVAWRACIDETSPDVKHFETRGTHIAMGASVEVFRLLPKLLTAER
jgi:pimeloyl-ACP methyl ester carboxylesterase